MSNSQKINNTGDVTGNGNFNQEQSFRGDFGDKNKAQVIEQAKSPASTSPIDKPEGLLKKVGKFALNNIGKILIGVIVAIIVIYLKSNNIIPKQ